MLDLTVSVELLCNFISGNALIRIARLEVVGGMYVYMGRIHVNIRMLNLAAEERNCNWAACCNAIKAKLSWIFQWFCIP